MWGHIGGVVQNTTTLLSLTELLDIDWLRGVVTSIHCVCCRSWLWCPGCVYVVEWFDTTPKESVFEEESRIKLATQPQHYNPDPVARMFGRANEAKAEVNGVPTTCLVDTGATVTIVSEDFCDQAGLKIQPLEQLVTISATGGTPTLPRLYSGYFRVSSHSQLLRRSGDVGDLWHYSLCIQSTPADRYQSYSCCCWDPDTCSIWMRHGSKPTYEPWCPVRHNKRRIKMETLLTWMVWKDQVSWGRKKKYSLLKKSKFGPTHKWEDTPKELWCALSLKSSWWKAKLCVWTPKQMLPHNCRVQVQLRNLTARSVRIPAKTTLEEVSACNVVPTTYLGTRTRTFFWR